MLSALLHQGWRVGAGTPGGRGCPRGLGEVGRVGSWTGVRQETGPHTGFLPRRQNGWDTVV